MQIDFRELQQPVNNLVRQQLEVVAERTEMMLFNQVNAVIRLMQDKLEPDLSASTGLSPARVNTLKQSLNEYVNWYVRNKGLIGNAPKVTMGEVQVKQEEQILKVDEIEEPKPRKEPPAKGSLSRPTPV